MLVAHSKIISPQASIVERQREAERVRERQTERERERERDRDETRNKPLHILISIQKSLKYDV